MTKRRTLTISELNNRKEMETWIRDIALAILLAVVLSQLMTPAIVHGASMEPTFYHGEIVLANRVAYVRQSPEPGDVILVQPPGSGDDVMIKRVIATENSDLRIENGQIFVNSQKISETYLKESEFFGTSKEAVPEDNVFVLGDNRNHSLDSRSWGPIEEERIVGKVLFRIYPIQRFGRIH